MHASKRSKRCGVAAALMDVKRSDSCEQFVVEYDEANVSRWIVHMSKDTFIADYPQLYTELDALEQKGGVGRVTYELLFDRDFPRVPPFVRVVSPRFAFHTGHVTVGGSICSEMLMSDGWKPDMNGSALLLALHSTLIEGKARLDFSNTRPYAFAEALEAFERVARDHGWSVPSNSSVRRR